jgi:hypothetical protein
MHGWPAKGRAAELESEARHLKRVTAKRDPWFTVIRVSLESSGQSRHSSLARLSLLDRRASETLLLDDE